MSQTGRPNAALEAKQRVELGTGGCLPHLEPDALPRPAGADCTHDVLELLRTATTLMFERHHRTYSRCSPERRYDGRYSGGGVVDGPSPGFGLGQGLAVEPLPEDRLDALVACRADVEGAPAGGLEAARVTVPFAEPQDAEAGPEPLWPRRSRAGQDGGIRGDCDAGATAEDLHGLSAQARLDLDLDESIRHANHQAELAGRLERLVPCAVSEWAQFAPAPLADPAADSSVS